MSDLDLRIGRIRDAADRLDHLADVIESAGARDTALRPTAALLRAVAVTHDHYGDCCCAEATAARDLADVIFGSQPCT